MGAPSSSSGTTDRIPNIIVIALTLFMLFMVKNNGENVDASKVRFEIYSIWILPAISIVWFLNRVFPDAIPDFVKIIVVLFAVIVGTIGIIITINRRKK